MAGGTFTAQNKTVPGVYIDVQTQQTLQPQPGPRGVMAMPLQLSWGPPGQVITINNGDDLMPLVGYSITENRIDHDPQQAILLIREAFKGSNQTPAPTEILLWRFSPDATAAQASVGPTNGLTATGMYSGVRGNDLSYDITNDPNNPYKFIVTTYLEGNPVCRSTNLETIEELIAAENVVISPATSVKNAWITWAGSGSLSPTMSGYSPTTVPLAGGLDGAVATGALVAFLEAISAYQFNVIGYPGTETFAPVVVSLSMLSSESVPMNIAIAHTATAHGLQTGDIGTITGATPTGYNLVNVTITVISTTSFSYPLPNIWYEAASGTMVFTLNSYATQVATQVATNNAVIIEYVQEWMNNEGKYRVAVIQSMLAADCELAIAVNNGVILNDGTAISNAQVVAWVAGATAGALYNESLTYGLYPGAVDCNPRLAYQDILDGQANGLFGFQPVQQNAAVPAVQVIDDINTWTEPNWTLQKNQTFSRNDFVRFEAQLCSDVQNLYSQYIIGKVRNASSGQTLMQSLLLSLLNDYQDQNVLQNVSAGDITVATGSTPNITAITLTIQYVGSVEQIYITVNVQ